jgi:5-methylcytosine-specific restriction endonuclease McrA
MCAWPGCRRKTRGKHCSKHAKLYWKKRNPDKVRSANAARRARKAGVPSEPISRAKVYARDKGVCGICGRKVLSMKWHMDHKHPLARGGSHTYANVQVAHPSCNLRKGAKIAA